MGKRRRSTEFTHPEGTDCVHDGDAEAEAIRHHRTEIWEGLIRSSVFELQKQLARVTTKLQFVQARIAALEDSGRQHGLIKTPIQEDPYWLFLTRLRGKLVEEQRLVSRNLDNNTEELKRKGIFMPAKDVETISETEAARQILEEELEATRVKQLRIQVRGRWLPDDELVDLDKDAEYQAALQWEAKINKELRQLDAQESQ